MLFGEKVRILRAQKAMTQQDLADRVGVSVSYISKVENGKLHFGDYPSEKFIHKLASELTVDEDELLLLANKVPQSILKRIRERPQLFHQLAKMDSSALDDLECSIKGQQTGQKWRQ